MNDLHKYHSLPGVKGGVLSGPMAKSVTGFIAALKQYRVVSDAGDYGSVIAYIDDDGAYRAAFMVYHNVQESMSCRTDKALRQWLREWLPAQRRPAEA